MQLRYRNGCIAAGAKANHTASLGGVIADDAGYLDHAPIQIADTAQ